MSDRLAAERREYDDERRDLSTTHDIEPQAVVRPSGRAFGGQAHSPPWRPGYCCAVFSTREDRACRFQRYHLWLHSFKPGAQSSGSVMSQFAEVGGELLHRQIAG